MVIDRLVEKFAPGAPAKARFNAASSIPRSDEPVLLMKPTTYMNRSGSAIAEAVRFYKLLPASDLFVIVDDVALPAAPSGSVPAAAPAATTGSATSPRLSDPMPTRASASASIPPRLHGPGRLGLGRFTDEQWTLMGPAIAKAAEAVEAFVTGGLDTAMNRFNAPTDLPSPSGSDLHGRRPGPASKTLRTIVALNFHSPKHQNLKTQTTTRHTPCPRSAHTRTKHVPDRSGRARTSPASSNTSRKSSPRPRRDHRHAQVG